MKNFTAVCFVLLAALLLDGCNSSTAEKVKPKYTYQVKMATMHKTLHFTGTIQPLRETPLTCPVNAIVQAMSYHYGQYVPKGEVIFVLNSAELQRQYNETLTEYLKAKDAHTIAQTKFIGTEELWRAGLLSKNNYLNEKSGVNTMRISLIQASRKLAEMLEKVGNNHDEDLASLSFAEFGKVRNALDGKHNLIQIRAPYSGILLYPPKNADDRIGHAVPGSTLKSGQVIGLIGDLRGIRVEVDIPEVDISQVHTGMSAKIRGVAFGQSELNGRLIAINAQASNASTGGLPSFSALIEVQSLSPSEQALIKVGMSATVELPIATSKQLLVPIAAIQQQAGQSMVQIQQADGQIKSRRVSTGMVNAEQVAIKSGLKVGEMVVYG